MNNLIKNISISGISTILPKTEIKVGDYCGDRDISRIINFTGIKSVRPAPAEVTSSQMAIMCSEQLIDQLKIDKRSIDGLVFSSQTPDFHVPSTSAYLQHKLGLSSQLLTFDINYGCSGYIFGLYQAAMMVSSGSCKRVLVCAGDTITKLLSPDDAKTRILFSDAFSATIVESGNTDMWISLETRGDLYKSLHMPRHYNHEPSYLCMNGNELSEYTINQVPNVLSEILVYSKYNRDDISTFVFHQPNQMLLNMLERRCQIKRDKMPQSLSIYGNTGVASIPVTLSFAHEQSCYHNTLLCGFGSGLTCGAMIVNLENTTMSQVYEF